MKKMVSEYVKARDGILKKFDCKNDYFIKPIEEYNWAIIENEGIFFLKYWKDGENVNQCVIVKKDAQPYVVRAKDYTMIVCIECVKIAIIAKNANEIN